MRLQEKMLKLQNFYWQIKRSMLIFKIKFFIIILIAFNIFILNKILTKCLIQFQIIYFVIKFQFEIHGIYKSNIFI